VYARADNLVRVGRCEAAVDRVERSARNALRSRQRRDRAAVVEQAARRVRRACVQVTNAKGEGTVVVARAQRPDLVRREVARLATEAVRAAELQASVVHARILDRVVRAVSVVEVVEVARVSSDVAAPLVACLERTNVVDDGVVLATHRDRAELRAGEADISLTAEHQATLAELAVVHVKAVFEHEDCLQAAAEVFSAAQAETAALHHAARQVVQVLAARIRVDVETLVDDAVQRDRALSVSNARERAQRSQREKRLLH